MKQFSAESTSCASRWRRSAKELGETGRPRSPRVLPGRSARAGMTGRGCATEAQRRAGAGLERHGRRQSGRAPSAPTLTGCWRCHRGERSGSALDPVHARAVARCRPPGPGRREEPHRAVPRGPRSSARAPKTSHGAHARPGHPHADRAAWDEGAAGSTSIRRVDRSPRHGTEVLCAWRSAACATRPDPRPPPHHVRRALPGRWFCARYAVPRAR